MGLHGMHCVLYPAGKSHKRYGRFSAPNDRLLSQPKGARLSPPLRIVPQEEGPLILGV